MRFPQPLSARAMGCVTVCLLAITLPSAALGQYTVKRLVFKGGEPYTQQQLEATADLKPGTHIGTAQMGEAAQRLMDTGAFKDVETTLNGPTAGIDVVFNLKTEDPKTFLPVAFQNIVWLTPQERDAELKQRVPLYTGKLPEAGTMEAAVQTALEAMLTAKGVNAKVEMVSMTANEGYATPTLIYRVTSPAVVLDHVRLSGIDPNMSAKENVELKNLIGKAYRVGFDQDLDDRLLKAYRDNGYLDAHIDGLQVTPSAPQNGTVSVSVTGAVVAGEAYKVGSVTWQGSEIVSTADFEKLLKLHPGDAASATNLRASYEPIVTAYLRKGYQDVAAQAVPTRDPAAHTVSYTIKVTPGEVYRMASTTTKGIDGKAKQDFDAAWRMKPGTVYDPVYAATFLTNNSAIKSLLPYTAVYQATAHPETHTVDLTLTFLPQAH